jgi:hypothetical protein
LNCLCILIFINGYIFFVTSIVLVCSF